jgi:hypothetical protein
VSGTGPNLSPASEHVWLPFADMFSEDDPVIREWLEIMRSAEEESEEE